MDSSSPLTRAALAGAVFLTATIALRADANVDKIKFSQPDKPGTFKIAVAHGSIKIHGEDAAEVTVKSEVQPQHHKRKDGLRVLTESATYSLTEKDNVIILDMSGDGWMGAPADFDITVPKATNIVVANSLGGEVVCGGVSGDLEIKSLGGEVQLADISGSAVVETMNGEISASVAELHDGKPLSFTSMNGAVVVHIPSAAKANVRLRTQNGTILTDFDDKALVTKVENVGGVRGRHGRMLTPEMHNVIREVTRAGAEAAKEIAQAAKEAARAAKDGVGVDDDDNDNDNEDSDTPGAPKPPGAHSHGFDFNLHIPPVPAIPPATGGKLVSGVLNGGGPEISITTMNGDVTLRRIEK